MSKKLIGNGFIYLFTNIFNAAIPFLLLPILTRVLTPEDYGLVTMFTLSVSILGTFIGLSVHGAISVKYFQISEEELSEYVASSLLILIVSCLLVLFIVWNVDFVSDYTLLPKTWLIIACFTAMSQFIVNIKLALWQVKKEAIKFALFKISLTLLNATLSVCFLFFLLKSWESRTLGISVSISLFSIIALLYLYLNGNLTIRIKQKHLLEILRFGVPLLPHAVGAFAISMVDRLIVANILGDKSVGVYMVGLQVAMVMAILSDAFSKVYSPWLYEKLKEKTESAYLMITSSTYIIFLFFSMMIFPVYFVLKFLLPYIVGSEFYSADELIIWFVIGNAFTGMYHAIAGLYFFTGRTGLLSMVTLFSGTLSILLTYYMVLRWGIIGGAISFAISNAFMFLSALFVSSFIIKLPWCKYYSMFVFFKVNIIKR